jgi:hypothetical protein
VKRWTLLISKYFFLIVFLGFYGSVTFFKHIHVVDGITIVHSHPFSSGKTNHTHSSKGYLTLQFLDDFSAAPITGVFNISTPHRNIIAVLLFRDDEFLMRSKSGVIQLRGPPEKRSA